MNDRDVKKLIKKAVDAVEAEIDAVRERPSFDVLFKGSKKKKHPPGSFYYEFESNNSSLKFAEVIRAEMEGFDDELEVYPVEVGEKKVVLDFPHNCGGEIPKVSLEWENDFVLRRLKSELLFLLGSDEKENRDRISKLFDPDPVKHHSDEETTRVLDDSRRNEAQHEALVKALQNDVLFVWGPPGTGKTSTLGYMIANYLVKGKRVLFASNTNRAVDVGLLSALEALRGVEKEHLEKKATRFGEIALESERLEQVLFDKQILERKEKQKNKAAKLSGTVGKYQNLRQEIDNLMAHGEEVPTELDKQMRLLENKLEKYGGIEEAEEQIEKMMSVNERFELEKRELVATTLAKVCTSDLFDGQYFEAVVIDEASMANLPYLMVLAAKAKKHIVVVGDPMQLPPIALTNEPAAREFLEKDIFTFASNSKYAEDLFSWHDFNRPVTAFFDTQYRLRKDLADVLSSVFYEGRLKTKQIADHADGTETNGNGNISAAVNVIDSQKYGAQLTQKDDKKGFSPVNKTHLEIIVKMLKRLVLKNRVPMNEIGIIVPFRNTVYDIRDRLFNEGFEQVEVGTIHTFQGREKQVIIFDTVMSGEVQRGGRRHYSVRPFDEEKNGLSVPRLLNVAFSRSKKRLVVLADMDHINRIYTQKYLGHLLRRFQEQER